MGLYYPVHLDNKNGKKTVFRCSECSTDLFTSSNVISGDFHGKYGEAFLVSNVINYVKCSEELRQMMTGVYHVCDIKCHQCHNYIGWKYIWAPNGSEEKYKEGKFVVEAERMKNYDSEKPKEIHFI